MKEIEFFYVFFSYLDIKYLDLAPAIIGVAKVSKGHFPPPFLISFKELYKYKYNSNICNYNY